MNPKDRGKAMKLENAKNHVVREEEIYYPVLKRYEVRLRLRDGREVLGHSANGYDVARGKALRSVMEVLPEQAHEVRYGLPSMYQREGVGSWEGLVDAFEDDRKYVRKPVHAH